MKNFEFNEHGVCTNPNVIEYEKGFCRFRIETAYTPYGWIYGLKSAKSAHAIYSPCTGYHGKYFPKEKDAILHAVNLSLEFFNEKHRCSSNGNFDGFIKVPKEIFEKLDDIINHKPRELDLFADYNFNE